jgi:MFS family permease
MASYIFIPNLARELGASNLEIGVIGAAYGIAVFVSSLIFGRASDMLGRKKFLHTGLALCMISFFLQIFAQDVLTLTIVRFFAGFTLGIFMAPLIAYAFETGGSMGRFSSYGSLGWAAGTLIAGIVAIYWKLFALSSLFFFLAFLASLRMKEVRIERIAIPILPIGVIKKNFAVYLAFFLRNLGANSLWVIFPLFLADLGATKLWIGIIYFVNSGAQFLIMRNIDRFKETQLISAGLVFSSCVFLSYSLATAYMQVIPIQLLLAASWSCLYVGSLLFLVKRNIEKATSIGVLNAAISISAVIGPLVGGAISQLWGFHAVMYFASIISAIGLLMCLSKYKI